MIKKEKKELTKEYLKECVTYNHETGIFIWNERPLHHFKNSHGMNTFNSQRKFNKINGIGNHGYLYVRINRTHYLLHRLAWFYEYGVWPKEQIDHINNIRTDNRIINLREAVNAENCQNKIKALSNNKSTGLLGSSFNKKLNLFRSYITINHKQKHLGYFNTALDAHNAYVLEKRKLHEFGML
jgi:hypothetical protein